jgi:hypothetical protein
MRHLKNIKVWGLAFSTMLLISGLAVGNASAAPQWTLNNGPISASISTTGTGTLELTDTNGFLGKTVVVKCTGTMTGMAGPGPAGTTKTVTVSSCVTVSGVCGSPSASAIDLPWKTELSTIEGDVRDTIKADGTGAPGYTIKCTIFGSTITDTCTSERGQPLVDLNTGPVPVTFEAESGTADCTLGGPNAGHVRGTVKVSAKSGTLTASD